MKRSWWMGLLIGVAVGAAVFTAGSGLYAQNRTSLGSGRVACLDVIKVFNEYERWKDLEEEIRAILEDRQNEIERRRGQIDTLQATLDAMSPDDPMYAKKTREMLALQIDFKNWSDLMQADMAREVGIWTRRMYREILGVTEEFALREGYDVVLYTSPPELQGFDPDAIQEQIRARKVVYTSPQADVTPVVLDRLNANYRAQPKQQMLQVSPTLPP
jgi:Skp family chaperone for outer membrane proteins